MSRANEIDNDNFEAPTKSRGLFQILWQRKAFVLLGAFLGLAAGFLYHTQKTTVYESYSQLTIHKKPSLNSSSNVMQEDPIPAYVAILNSPHIADFAIRKQRLMDTPTFQGNASPVEYLISNLKVDRDKKLSPGTTNNIILLSYKGPYPEDCRQVLTGINEAFQDHLERQFFSSSKTFYEIVTKAREKLELDLATSWQKYREFRANSQTNTSPKDGRSIGFELVANLESELSQHQVKLAKKKKELDVLEEAIKDGKALEFLTVGNFEKLENLKNQVMRYIEEPLIKLKVEEQALLQSHGAKHPRVLGIRAQIEKMEAELTRLAPKISQSKPEEQIRDAWKLEIKQLEGTIQALEVQFEQKKKDLRKSTDAEVEESRFRSEFSRNESFLEAINKQLTHINLTRDDGGWQTTILHPPGIGVKIAPIAYQNLTAGLVLGLLGGVCLAYLADLADKSFRSPEEIRDQLGLPLVGHIPFFKGDAETTAKRAAGESTIEPMLCCYFKPKSLDSEAYRAVRTALFFSTQGQGLKVIQVTSPNKGDGKSLMISNLAITTAQSGKRVLLIDADCRRPRQHKIFNVPNDAGLTSVLTGMAEIRDTIREVCVPGLHVMGSGPIPPNPSELLVSPKFKEVLDSLRGEYDYVFVDTPPLLAVTDPCVVAGKVDGLFLAIRLTRKGRPDAERAREILNSVNVKVFGIVVNGVTRVTSGLYSSQAYDYTDTYVDYENEDKDYYYADEDPEEAEKSKEVAKA